MNANDRRQNGSLGPEAVLEARQRRELEYHEEFAKQNLEKATQPVLLDVIAPGRRRPWNSYWTAYDLLMSEGLEGKRVLIPGCGFGEDAIRLAKLNAEVYAFDLSSDLLQIAKQRALLMGVKSINFDIMPAEALSYPVNFFDLVFFNDILHHVDIGRTSAETQRVLKSGGRVVANELYTHSWAQQIRNSALISRMVYPRMVRFIYGTDRPYITEDEHKINEHELAIFESILQDNFFCQYFLFLGGRILPSHWRVAERIDQAVLTSCGRAGRVVAGRVVLAGTVAN